MLLENDIEIIQNVGFVISKIYVDGWFAKLYKCEMNIKDNMKTKIVYSYYKYQKKENDLFWLWFYNKKIWQRIYHLYVALQTPQPSSEL